MTSALGDMVVRIVGDATQFNSTVDTAEKKFIKFGVTATTVGKVLTASLTLPIVAVGAAALKSAGQFEMYQSAFETMLGSASKASALIADLQDMAAKTPFEMSDLAQGTKVLLQFGVTSDDILGVIRRLGDVAQGNKEKFASLALVYGQVQSKGKLMGDDLRQMIEAGFNPLKEIARTTGQTMGDLTKKMSDGSISAQMVADAFKTATANGGLFFNGMEKASKTLPGLMSTLKDDMMTAARAFVQDLMPAVKDTVKSLSTMFKWLTDLNPAAKAFIITTLGIAASLGPVIAAIGGISKAIAFLAANPAVAAIAAIGTLVTLIVSLKAAAKTAAETMAKDWTYQTTKSIAENQKQLGVLKNIVQQYFNERDALKKGSAEWNLANNRAMEATEAYRIFEAAVYDHIKASKLGTQQTSEEAEATASLNTELESQIAARKAAQVEYDNAIAASQRYIDNGLKSEEEAMADIIEAAKTYAQALIDAGYTINEDSIGGRALKDMLILIQDAEDAAVQATLDTNTKRSELSKTFISWFVNEDAKRAKAASDHEAYITKHHAEQADQRKKKTEEEQKAWIEGFTNIVGVAGTFVGQLNSIYDSDVQNQLDAISVKYEAQIAANDAALQAALAAKGVAVKTEKERAQEEIAVINEQLATELNEDKKIELAKQKAEKETIINRYDITQEYAEKEKAIRKQQALDEYNIKLKAFEANKKMQIANALIGAAQAAIQAFAQLGPVAGAVAAAVVAGLTAYQIKVINDQVAPTPPALADGGIVTPVAGGRMVNVAEAGQAEAVIPLDRLDQMLSRNRIGNIAGGGEQPVHLVVQIDSKPILDKIFPATRNKTVLIDARSVI